MTQSQNDPDVFQDLRNRTVERLMQEQAESDSGRCVAAGRKWAVEKATAEQLQAMVTLDSRLDSSLDLQKLGRTLRAEHIEWEETGMAPLSGLTTEQLDGFVRGVRWSYDLVRQDLQKLGIIKAGVSQVRVTGM